MARTPDAGGGIVWTNLNFYNSVLNDHPLVEKRKLSLEKKRQSVVPFVNLADKTTSTADTSTLPFDIPFFMNQHEKELCKGKQNRKIKQYLMQTIWHHDKNSSELNLSIFTYFGVYQ